MDYFYIQLAELVNPLLARQAFERLPRQHKTKKEKKKFENISKQNNDNYHHYDSNNNNGYYRIHA